MADLLGALRRAIMPTEAEKASRRWRRVNTASRAAGCQCGKPATEVRYFPDVMGSVPHETWTCVKHVGVERWKKVGDGPWAPEVEMPPMIRTPIGDFTGLADMVARWPEPVLVLGLRCGPGVVATLFGLAPLGQSGSELGVLSGVPIIVDSDFAPGVWQFVGADGAIIKSGTVAVREATKEYPA